MNNRMKSICFFSSYFEKDKIPYFIKCYLLELKNHFNELVLLSNEKTLSQKDMDFLKNNGIEWMPVKNEGYDFGMWYKAFKAKPVMEYDRIGLVNDSCILFKKLDDTFKVINESGWDYCGLVDSAQIEYHIQSYFLVMNRAAAGYVDEFFIKHGIINDIDDVIRTYEVGITSFLKEKKLKIGAVYTHDASDQDLNPSFYRIVDLINRGFPMIKKKIIFGNYKKGEVYNLSSAGFRFNPSYYLKLIKKQHADLIIDLKLLKSDYNHWQVNSRLLSHSFFLKIYFSLKNMARFIYRKYIK